MVWYKPSTWGKKIEPKATAKVQYNKPLSPTRQDYNKAQESKTSTDVFKAAPNPIPSNNNTSSARSSGGSGGSRSSGSSGGSTTTKQVATPTVQYSEPIGPQPQSAAPITPAQPTGLGKLKAAAKSDISSFNIYPRNTINAGVGLISSAVEKPIKSYFPSSKPFLEKKFNFPGPATIISTSAFSPLMGTTGELRQGLASRGLIKLEQAQPTPVIFRTDITQLGESRAASTIAARKGTVILSKDFIQPSGKLATGGQITIQRVDDFSYDISLIGKVSKLKSSSIKPVTQKYLINPNGGNALDNVLGKVSISTTSGKGSAAQVGSVGLRKFRVSTNLLDQVKVTELPRPTKGITNQVGYSTKYSEGVFKYIGADKPARGKIVSPTMYGKIVQVETPQTDKFISSSNGLTSVLKKKSSFSFTPSLEMPKQVSPTISPPSISSAVSKTATPSLSSLIALPSQTTKQETINPTITRMAINVDVAPVQTQTPTIRPAVIPIISTRPRVGTGSSPRYRQPVIELPGIDQTPREAQIPKPSQINIPRQTTGNYKIGPPSVPTPFITYTPVLPVTFKFNPQYSGSSSNILRGGKRSTGFTPSFGYAIGLKTSGIKSKVFKYSGIDYRPGKFKISTSNFKFKI